MRRQDYLDDIHVAGFINWLRDVIVTEEAFTQSYYPRNGKAKNEVTLTSFRNAASSYNFDGQDLSATQEVLDELAASIHAAMQAGVAELDAGQQHSLLIACLKTLVWGGVTVTSTIDWLANRAQAGALKESLRIGGGALVADSLDALDPFKGAEHLRSDSAATKLYALADNRSIIYDNRVGAALAKFVCEYLDHVGIQKLPETLAFMVEKGQARRDPSEKPDRKFKRKKAGYSHAIWNQRANWIVHALVADGGVMHAMNVFEGVSPIRTIEAALFVIGDDVGNLSVHPTGNAVAD